MSRFVLLLGNLLCSTTLRASSLNSDALQLDDNYGGQILIAFVGSVLCGIIFLLRQLHQHKKNIIAVSQARDSLEKCLSERNCELAELRLLFKNVAQAAKFGVFDYDVVTGKLNWDASMFNIFGVSSDEFSCTYTAWRNAVLPEDLPAAETALQNAIRGDAPFNTHFRIRRGSEILTIHGLAQIYRDNDGKPLRVIGVNQDVTEYQQQEIARVEVGHFAELRRYEPPVIEVIEPPPVNVLEGRRVLLIEDNAITRELVVALLSNLAMVVECAEDGRQGLQRIAATTFDVVLMDIHMPEMDGITATRLIRADKRFAQLPIIAMTAHSFSDNYKKSLAAGMNDHLVKPVDVAKLTNTLKYWLTETTQNPTVNLATTPPPVSDDDLPASLPPFDIAAALLRANNNPKLLRKLLLMFYDNYAQAIANLQQLLATEDYAAAHRLAHSLKGVAGTLEARHLYTAAADLEQALRNNDNEAVTGLIDDLHEQLHPALTAAASLRN